MQVKLLRQAAGRDDRIVAVYEDVTFLNEHVGWYLIIKDHERAARTGRNPQTGAEMTIAASKAPKFKAGKALKDMLNA